MATSHSEGAPRYSLKTLQALHDGSVGGRSSAVGELWLTITDEDHHTFQARVTSVGPTLITVAVNDDDGTVRPDIQPAWVEHAEVVE